MAERNSWEALADATRREILLMLRSAPHSAGQIAEQFSISKPSISHHLNILKEAGLVRYQKRGQHIFYTIAPEAFMPLRQYLEQFEPADAPERSASHSQATPVPAPEPVKKPEEISSSSPSQTKEEGVAKSEKKPEKARSSVPFYLY